MKHDHMETSIACTGTNGHGTAQWTRMKGGERQK